MTEMLHSGHGPLGLFLQDRLFTCGQSDLSILCEIGLSQVLGVGAPRRLPKPNDPNPEAMLEVGEAAGQGEEEEAAAAGKGGCPEVGAGAAEDEEGAPKGEAGAGVWADPREKG